jgi:hypothetical protein
LSEPLAIPPPPPPTLPPTGSASASSQAITALVLGILGLVCCPILGPIAWYLSLGEARAIREGRSPRAGEGLTLAAKILGILGTIYLGLSVLWIFGFGGMVVLQGLANHR